MTNSTIKNESGLDNMSKAIVEIDNDGFIWCYKGKDHGNDSWYGIPPENKSKINYD